MNGFSHTGLITCLLSPTVFLFFNSGGTPIWRCHDVYGHGFYANSCINMHLTALALPITIMIIGIIFFYLGYKEKNNTTKVMKGDYEK